nr:GDP-mannose 4,6-dehydratase [Accumulibacter sp.]
MGQFVIARRRSHRSNPASRHCEKRGHPRNPASRHCEKAKRSRQPPATQPLPIVAVDPRCFRPAEVETLLGDPAKAKAKLGWVPKTTFDELVAEMVREDLKSAERDELVKKHGYKAMDYDE